MPGAGITLFSLIASEITVAAVVTFIAKTALTVAISSIFSKKPKATDFGSAAREQQVTARDPVSPTRVIFGETITGGTIVFMNIASQYAGSVSTVVEQHTAAASVTVALRGDDEVVPASGVWASDVGVELVDYSEASGYSYTSMTAVGSSPAQGEYSVSGGVYSFNAADWNRSVRITFNLRVNQTVVGRILNMVIELASHEVEEIGDIYFDDELIPLNADGMSTGRLQGRAYVFKHLGSADQEADARLIAGAPGQWTTAHRLRGRAYILVSLIKDINPGAENNFPNGVPNIRAQVKGLKVYDPRSGLTAWSDNVALCINEYLTNTVFGLGHVYADEIDEDLLIAAANVCDESVSLAGGGTEARYTCNGSFLTSEAPKEILGKLQVAMAGRCVRSGGKWGLYAGAYITPTVTLDEDDLRGPIQVKPRLSRRELFNAVKGVYVNPDNGYQPADFPVVTNATYLSEDQDERIWLDMDLPWTGTPSMAQRIAKIELERVRQQIIVVMPCKLSAYSVVPPNTVMVTNAKFGWSSKVFEVIDVKLVMEQGDKSGPYLGVDLVLRETASTVFDWSSGEETTVDAAPDTNLPDPFSVAPPGTPEVTESIYETTGSAGVKSRATVSWAAGGDAQAVEYGLEYRSSGATGWTRRPLVRGLMDVLDDLAPGHYEFRVRAFSSIGASSAYSATSVVEILGLSAPPAAVSGFSVIKSSGFGLAQWTLHPDLDVQINGAIVIRHSPLTTGATWVDGVIVEEFPGGVVSGLLPLITGTYMAKARDSSGNYSEDTVSFVATEGLITGFSTVGSLTEHTAFTGSKTNVALDATFGGIKLDGSTTIDNMVTNVDDWPFIDALGGISATGSYAFASTLDLSTVATRRVEADIKVLSFDTGDTIDNRTDNIDLWDSIDGGVVNDCDVTLYARTTDDDPSGSPVWGDWVPFFVADFTCRALQFKLDFISGNATHNIVCTELAVHAKEPA